MARHEFDPTDPRFRGNLKSTSWTLCVGAGICQGVMPSWGELCRRIVNRTFNQNLSSAEFEDIARNSGWGFDAWIQASLNRFLRSGGEPDSFSALVEQELYADLRSMARLEGLERPLLAAFNTPELLTKDEFDRVYHFVNRLGITALPLADVLLSSVDRGCPPRSIITFNYDTTLQMVLRMKQIEARSERVGRHEFPPVLFTRQTGPVTASPGIVPICHVHGSVVPRTGRRRRRTPHDTRDRIVGPESTYLMLAGVPWAWAQTTFLYRAQRDSFVLLGHSMGDPNLRRWLSWACAVRKHEVERVVDEPVNVLPHLWLRTRPKSESHQLLLPDALTHLGVRIAWLDSWGEVHLALENLLALTKPDVAEAAATVE